MKYTYIVIAFFLIFILGGCKKDYNSANEVEFSKVVDLSLHENLTAELGIYTGQFVLHNGNVNIQTTIKSNINNELFYAGRIVPWYFENISSSQPILANGGDYFVNNLQFTYNGAAYFCDQIMGLNNQVDLNFVNNFIENEVIGKEINIKNIQNGEEVFNEQFYVPKEIQLMGKLENKIPETNLIKMNRNDFTFSYNQDSRNENGLLIKLYYHGEFYGMGLGDFQNIDQSNNKSRAIHIKNESSDKITIPIDFFEGIPSNGIATIYIGRGNGKIFNVNGKEQYIRSFTARQFRVVLE